MTSKSEVHLPLISGNVNFFDADSSGNQQDRHNDWTRKPRFLTNRDFLFLSIIFVQAVGLLLLAFRRPACTPTVSPNHVSRLQLYSPANDILEDQIKVFSNGLGSKKTIYQGYSDESDSAWQDLYNQTIMRVPKSEAMLLPNRTWPIQEDPGYYIAQLDVFHQLHCLNKLRQGLRRDIYEPLLQDKNELAPHHLSHCVDSLRQHLMCHSDPAVVIWQWDSRKSKVAPSFDYPHMCKNFEKLRGWVADRHIGRYIDPSVYIESDLPLPAIIH